MKIAFFFLFILNSLFSFSQEGKTITVNTLEQPTALNSTVFLYPDFTAGTIFYKDGGLSEGKLNYNRLTGQVLFLSPPKDTLALAHPETMTRIVIGTDTFSFFKNEFLQKLTHYSGPDLYVKKSLKFIGKEKKGAYGTYSPVSAVNSNSTYTTEDDNLTVYISVDENMIYQEKYNYYFSDGFNNFFPATKSKFYNLFSQYEKQLKTFIDENKLNFNRRADLLRLIEHAVTLKTPSKS
jgi:hypothetical protein